MREIERLNLFAAMASSSSYRAQPEEDLDKYECNICCKEQITRALSCGHALCTTCANTFLDTKCPYCNQVPQGFQKIYFT